jgi:hypothetical protein
VSARTILERMLFAVATTCAAILCLLALGGAAGRWELVPVTRAGANVNAPPGALGIVVPVPSARVRSGDHVYTHVRQHAASVQRVEEVTDSFRSTVRFAGDPAGVAPVRLAPKVWRVRALVAYLGAVLRIMAGPLQSALLIIVGCALLYLGTRDRRRRTITSRSQRNARWQVATTGVVTVALIAALTAGARAVMIASTSTSIVVTTASDFPQMPDCWWTDAAEVTLSWDADPDATSYDVMRSESAHAGYASIANVAAGVTTYADTTVNPDPEPVGQYFYKIRANKLGGNTLSRYTDTTQCPGYLTTYAGGNGPTQAATSVTQSPESITISGTTMYVAEDYGVVRAIDMNTGNERTVGGAKVNGTHGDGGPATFANFGDLTGIVTDSEGNQYVADKDARVVRKISADGTEVSIYAGTSGSPCAVATNPCGDGGAATSAQLNNPTALAIDSNDNLYIADTGDNRIRMVSAANGHISAFAGTGDECGSPVAACGDGGDAVDADLNSPQGVAVDEDDNVYIADTEDYRIRVVSGDDGTISNFSGSGTRGSTTWDNDGGATADAHVSSPVGIYADTDGAVYVAEQGADKIRKFASGVASTLAGTTGVGSPADGSNAVDARLMAVGNVTGDAAGNVYFSDGTVVRIVTPDGRIGRFAGGGTSCDVTDPCGDGGFARDATFHAVTGIAVDDVGNVYVADAQQNRVRRIAPDGIITAFAGNGIACTTPTLPCGDGGAATDAEFKTPIGLSWGDGALFVADSGDERIRKVATTGDHDSDIVTAVAGTGTAGDSGDGADATDAEFHTPSDVYWKDASHIFVADTANHRVRVFADGGNVDAFAGTGVQGFSGDGSDAVDAKLNQPAGLAYHGTTLYIADRNGKRVRSVTGGTIDTFTGGGIHDFWADSGLDADHARYYAPKALAWDPASDSLYIAEPEIHQVRKFSGGAESIVAGDGVAGWELSSLTARLGSPTSVAVDGNGNIYIADVAANRILMLNLGVQPTLYAGTGDEAFANDSNPLEARFGAMGQIARAPNGDMYVPDPPNHRVRKIAANGVVTTVAGDGDLPTWAGDGGPREDARFTGDATGVARDAAGNLYAAEPSANRVRILRATGDVETFAGNGVAGSSGDGGAATLAKLDGPSGVAVDADGNVYIADRNNNRIRVVDASGAIDTFAGDGSSDCGGDPTCGDGGDATDAQLDEPFGLTIDEDGNLLITEFGGCRIRKVDLDTDVISRVAGTGACANIGEGWDPVLTSIGAPLGITVDPATGDIYVAVGGSEVKKISGGAMTTFAGTGNGGDTGDGGDATDAELTIPFGVAWNPVNGSLYISDGPVNRIREVRQDGKIYAFSGSNGTPFGGDGLQYDDPGVGYFFPEPLLFAAWGVTDATHGTLYIGGRQTVRYITLDTGELHSYGSMTEVTEGGDGGDATAAQLDMPAGVALDSDGNLYIADANAARVRKVDTNGHISTLAGGDGTFGSPDGLAVDGNDDVYVSDALADKVFKVDHLTQDVTTYAGTGATGDSGDGGPATSAEFTLLMALAWNGDDLYIADGDAHKIRKVDENGDISTVAGDGGAGRDGDGGLATDASIGFGTSLALDGDGNLYIGTFSTEPSIAVRRVDHVTGNISTVTLTTEAGHFGDEGGARHAGFMAMGGLALDDDGNLYIAEGFFFWPVGGTLRKVVGPL